MIDSPPIIAVTDAAIISQYVDGTMFVVRSFKTNKHLVRQGIRALLDVGAPLAGVVLNAVNLHKQEYSHYYHYYYYKRDGYGSGTVTDPRASKQEVPHTHAPSQLTVVLAES